MNLMFILLTFLNESYVQILFFFGLLNTLLLGAAMQAKSGPQASALGCAGFAGFSLIIDKVISNYLPI